MTDLPAAVSLGQQALWLAVVMSAPAVCVAALVGLMVAVFQAASQINDAALAHVPRFLAVTCTLLFTGGLLARQLTEFAVRAFSLTP